MALGGRASERRTAIEATIACRDFGPQAQSLLVDGLSCGQYLEKLVERRLFLDAVRFVAYVLPSRHAVWWACLSLAELHEIEKLSPAERGVLKAGAVWVVQPNETNRIRVERLGARIPTESAYHWLARSAAFVEFPLPKPAYSDPQDFRARGLVACVGMAMAEIEVAGVEQALAAWRSLIALGYDISRGGHPWSVS